MNDDSFSSLFRDNKKRTADRTSFNEAMSRLSKLKARKREEEKPPSEDRKKAA